MDRYYYTAIRIVLKYPLLIGVLPSIAINSFASMGEHALAPVFWKRTLPGSVAV